MKNKILIGIVSIVMIIGTAGIIYVLVNKSNIAPDDTSAFDSSTNIGICSGTQLISRLDSKTNLSELIKQAPFGQTQKLIKKNNVLIATVDFDVYKNQNYSRGLDAEYRQKPPTDFKVVQTGLTFSFGGVSLQSNIASQDMVSFSRFEAFDDSDNKIQFNLGAIEKQQNQYGVYIEIISSKSDGTNLDSISKDLNLNKTVNAGKQTVKLKKYLVFKDGRNLRIKVFYLDGTSDVLNFLLPINFNTQSLKYMPFGYVSYREGQNFTTTGKLKHRMQSIKLLSC